MTADLPKDLKRTNIKAGNIVLISQKAPEKQQLPVKPQSHKTINNKRISSFMQDMMSKGDQK